VGPKEPTAATWWVCSRCSSRLGCKKVRLDSLLRERYNSPLNPRCRPRRSLSLFSVSDLAYEDASGVAVAHVGKGTFTVGEYQSERR